MSHNALPKVPERQVYINHSPLHSIFQLFESDDIVVVISGPTKFHQLRKLTWIDAPFPALWASSLPGFQPACLGKIKAYHEATKPAFSL